MCTLAIFYHKDRTLISMNRDEAYDRPLTENFILLESDLKKQIYPASQVKQEIKTPYKLAYPEDNFKKGSWIALGSQKIVCVLLNGYQSLKEKELAQKREFLSRGEIPLILADSETLKEAENKLRTKDLTLYQPFSAILFHPEEGIMKLSYRSQKLTKETYPLESFFISSSFLGDKASQTDKLCEWEKDKPFSHIREMSRRMFFTSEKLKGFSIKRESSASQSYSEIYMERQGVEFLHYNFPPSQYKADDFSSQSSCLKFLGN